MEPTAPWLVRARVGGTKPLRSVDSTTMPRGVLDPVLRPVGSTSVTRTGPERRVELWQARCLPTIFAVRAVSILDATGGHEGRGTLRSA